MAETHVSREGVRLRWQSDGSPSSPAILFLNSLGTDLSMWNGVVERLLPAFRVLRMDTRGHGRSDVPGGDYSIHDMALDAVAVLDAARVRTVAVCGLSMGGMVAMHLALHAPDRISHVIVANSSAQVPSAPWKDRAALVRSAGMPAVADTVMSRFFSEAFRSGNPGTISAAKSTLLATDPQGYAASCMAIADVDLLALLPKLSKPLLVINGERDEATPPADHGARIAAAVPGACAATLPTGHLSALERPSDFAAALTQFLQPALMDKSRDGPIS